MIRIDIAVRQTLQVRAQTGEQLFERLPMLYGFHVTAELDVVEVAVEPWAAWLPPHELSDEIRAALDDLIFDGTEQTAALMRGRTFARTFH